MTDPAQAADELDPSAGDPPPQTGDARVDDALAHLHRTAQEGDLDAQAQAGEAADRALRARLSDLGSD